MCIAAMVAEKAIDKSPVANYLEKEYGLRPHGITAISRMAGHKDPNKFYQEGGRGYQAPASRTNSHSQSNAARNISIAKAKQGG